MITFFSRTLVWPKFLSVIFFVIATYFLFLGGTSIGLAQGKKIDNFQLSRQAVVHVKATLFRYSYKNPWTQPHLVRAAGTGYIVSGNRILTNAHVVSGANTIRLRRPNQKTDYEAKVMHIAHDCDLALLTVEDKSFFRGVKPLRIGKMPKLNSPVEVIGFPVGGDRVSITRGIVSRVDMDVYSHSGIDYHLTIQVDAAINPGNSGGPAMQNGKVIGTAFQALPNGENLGYLIPPPVILRFLEDTKDGKYDGYTEFGVVSVPTRHKILRRALGIEKSLQSPETGVLVRSIIPGSSADGHLKPGDILFRINKKSITEDGDVELGHALRNYSELVDNLHIGDMVEVEVLRNSKQLKMRFPSKATRVFRLRRRRYEMPPSYLLMAGLVFQPMDANVLQSYSSAYGIDHPEIRYRYDYFFLRNIYKSHSEDVLFSHRLPDRVNIYADDFKGALIQKVNGIKIKGFVHFVKLIDEAIKKGPYLVLHFYHNPTPLVLKTSLLVAANQRVFQNYGIRKDRFIGTDFLQD